jgi:hypothetical protein
MKRRSSQIAALIVVLFAPSLSAQVVRAREGVILRQPILREPISSRTVIASDPLASVTITTSPPAPNLSAPSFEVKSFNVDNGAVTDAQGKTIRTNLALTPTELRACPLTPMFYFGPSAPAVPAASFYTGLPETATTDQKYSFIGGSLYFRPPPVPDQAFPGELPSTQGAKNSWVYVVNCRNEVSNALPFRVEPTKFQITRVSPAAFVGGQQIVVGGTGLAGLVACDSITWCTPTQKVIFTFKLGKNNVSNTALDVVEREFEAPAMTPPSIDERYTNVYVPSIEGQGYTKNTWVLLESKVQVVKNGVRSNALPIRYCSSVQNTSIATGSCW